MVKREVLKLIQWCNTYHGGKLMAYGYSLEVHNDQVKKGHKQMVMALKRLKCVAGDLRAGEYHDSLSLMDQKYGRAWRSGGGGKALSHAVSRP